jgi:hypothetical protein
LGDCDVRFDDCFEFGDEFEFKVGALAMDIGDVAFPIIVLVDEFLEKSHAFYPLDTVTGGAEEDTSVPYKRVVFPAIGSQTGDTELQVPDRSLKVFLLLGNGINFLGPKSLDITLEDFYFKRIFLQIPKDLLNVGVAESSVKHPKLAGLVPETLPDRHHPI